MNTQLVIILHFLQYATLIFHGKTEKNVDKNNNTPGRDW